MDPNAIFKAATIIAIAAWLMLAIVPNWRFTRTIVMSGGITILFAVVYAVLIAMFYGPSDGGFTSLDSVVKLFSSEWTVLAAWMHFLAFDLFIGTWIVKDAERRSIPHIWVIPCLVFTFLLGPLGFLIYFIFCIVAGKQGPNSTTLDKNGDDTSSQK